MKKTALLLASLFTMCVSFGCDNSNQGTNNDTQQEQIPDGLRPTNVTSTDTYIKYPFYMKLTDSAKKIELTMDNISKIDPYFKKFTWSVSKAGVINYVVKEDGSKPTMVCNVTPLGVGEVVLTATNTFDNTISIDFTIRVIDFKSTDYLWQYKKDEHKQFGVDSTNKQGTTEGTVTFDGLSWSYERNRATSISGYYGCLKLGKSSSYNEQNNAEDFKLTNVNTKKVKSIEVETASAYSLADFSISVGGNEVLNEKASRLNSKDQTTSYKIENLNNLQGDIVLSWDNPDYDVSLGSYESPTYDENYKAPGAIYLKSIIITYGE